MRVPPRHPTESSRVHAPSPDPEHSDSGEAFAVPRETTPAWESELLLSIGLVVALLQLPSVVDGWWDRIEPSTSLRWYTLVVYMRLYTEVALLGLGTTFLVHLIARGFWVALLGLRSVFPGPPDWDRLREGPIGRELSRRSTVPLAEMIERTDNLASLVFAFGFMLLAMSATGMLITGLAVVLANAMAVVVGDDNLQRYLMPAIAILILPALLPSIIDRRIGERLAPDGRAARLLRSLIRLQRRLTLPPVTQSMQATWYGHIGQRRGSLLLGGALFVLMLIATSNVLGRRERLADAAVVYLPGAEVTRYDSALYAGSGAQRRVDQAVLSAMVAGNDPLRLFIPHIERHFGPTLRRDCAASSTPADGDALAEAARRHDLLECIVRVLDLRVDDTPVPAGRVDFARDEVDGAVIDGYIAFLPTTDLAGGRHRVSYRMPRARADQAERRVIIPFWK
jgi:hypothetical protein